MLAARHELQEETGLAAANVTYRLPACGSRHINQGYRLFLANGLAAVAGPAREQEDQDMVTRPFTRAEFETMLLDGTITDARVHACFGLLQLKGRL